MVNLDTVSMQSTSHHMRNQLSHGGGGIGNGLVDNHLGGGEPTNTQTIAVDDLLGSSQTETVFNVGKTASSALNKT